MLLRIASGGKGGARSGRALALGLAALFVLLAMIRPVNHDESQYVAAAMLARNGLPWIDFPYFQMPLQPMLLSPFAAAAGMLAWPALRVINALFGAGAVASVWRAARLGGADERIATVCAGLFAATDILLFSVGTARNDALPATALAGALLLMVKAAKGAIRRRDALVIGLLLSVAVGAKISYAFPAAAFFVWALLDRRYRPEMVLIGALPVVALIGWMVMQAPEAARFEVLTFPALAPDQMYREAGREFKLSLLFKGLDTLKFLALGAALPAIVAVIARIRRSEEGVARLLDVMIIAGAVAALLPEPTWRQYLLPVLPPLFIRLALLWQQRPPVKWERIAFAIFFFAGLAPSVEGLVLAARGGIPMAVAVGDGLAIRRLMDEQGLDGPVAGLAPQYIAATGRPIDPRFAAGPFYFRSHDLLSELDEQKLNLLSAKNLTADKLPNIVLVGGDADAEGGDAKLEALLAAAAGPRAQGIARVKSGKFMLYVLR